MDIYDDLFKLVGTKVKLGDFEFTVTGVNIMRAFSLFIGFLIGVIIGDILFFLFNGSSIGSRLAFLIFIKLRAIVHW